MKTTPPTQPDEPWLTAAELRQLGLRPWTHDMIRIAGCPARGERMRLSDVLRFLKDHAAAADAGAQRRESFNFEESDLPEVPDDDEPAET